MELHAKYTIFAKGPRHLGKQIIAKYQLDAGKDPQSYGLGIKELWEIDPARHKPGFVMHTAGWPMDSKTYGGAFLYHLDDSKVTLGFVIGLDYDNPYLSPFEIPALEDPSQHPPTGDESKGIPNRPSAWATGRARHHGRRPAVPAQVRPGGALVGCDAGFLNVSRIKGSHAAIKTGMLAAEARMTPSSGRQGDELAPM
ncbi:Electron transfer flavoprotein-ubiquinone oxidoreductase, mitochondrial [Manis javanica]|nr:Electron transfer flavoprotein-ubiquinone oxidoreductase, mitochondrial [Manis javanica]